MAKSERTVKDILYVGTVRRPTGSSPSSDVLRKPARSFVGPYPPSTLVGSSDTTKFVSGSTPEVTLVGFGGTDG